MLAVTLAAALALASSVYAQPSPLTPGVGREGENCIISWTPDQTGSWKTTNIELMTGSNLAMVHLTTVATIDTTAAAATTYTWRCPDVTLNSAVYFYQFSHQEEPNNLQWTTRWAIAAADGSTVPPPQTEMSGGQAIGWGTGALVNTALIKAAPAYIEGQTSQVAGGGPVPSVSASIPAAVGSVTASVRLSTSVRPSVSSRATASASASASSSSNAAGHSTSQNSLLVAGVGAIAAAIMAVA